MLNLDFAFFNLIEQDRQGLIYRKYFLDRLAPLLFTPRIQRLIEIPGLGAGCNIHLPLGGGNFINMHEEVQKQMLDRTGDILQELNLSKLAVDRRLQRNIRPWSKQLSLLFGDQFIKALAYTFIKESIDRTAVRKIILTGEMAGAEDLLETAATFRVPISIQTDVPANYELMTYRLLYEKGCAISNSFIKPHEWKHGDVVIAFDGLSSRFSMAAPGICYRFLTCETQNLAPELEAHLSRGGINPQLGTLAPILESCLLPAGEMLSNSEQQKENSHKFLDLQKHGQQIGLWDHFLDKA
ncbi:MAG: hypothetical protein ACOX6L_08440 [Syntrophomonadaceae bacterium]|jgi:hypothetical protein